MSLITFWGWQVSIPEAYGLVWRSDPALNRKYLNLCSKMYEGHEGE